MEKKIHDEKMARFQEHAKKVKEATEKNKEVVETQPTRHKRVDTGLSQPNESPAVKISISPTRKGDPKVAFEVKKTTRNHFTGRSLAAEGKKEVEIDMPEDRDPSLYVQVGEQKCVFKYGDRPNPEPRLIESVISYVKEEDAKGQQKLFTQTLRRNRSASEEAFFSNGKRKLSLEKGNGAYGLTGAQGNVSPGLI